LGNQKRYKLGINVSNLKSEGEEAVCELAYYCIKIPESDETLVPILDTIPLQLLSYHIALLRGCNVDQPWNLTKSVTVE